MSSISLLQDCVMLTFNEDVMHMLGDQKSAIQDCSLDNFGER